MKAVCKEESIVSVRINRRYELLCRQFANQLAAPVLRAGDPVETNFLIEFNRHGPVLYCLSLPYRQPFQIDFARVRKNGPGKAAGPDPLLRAIGAQAKTVVDVTAGWASDAVHLARCGLTVIAVEKNHLVVAMLMYAYGACLDEQLKTRLEIVHADGAEYLRTMTNSPDVVYLDPMYPPKSKSAAVKKPLAILQMLVGPAGNAAVLFEQAMSQARRRVVVKRPHHAPPIYPGKVGETRGKLVRFDIYKPAADLS